MNNQAAGDNLAAFVFGENMKRQRLITRIIALVLCVSLLPLSACSKKKADETTAESGATATDIVNGSDTSAIETTVTSESEETSSTTSSETTTTTVDAPVYGSSILNTGNLTEKGNGYEGIEGTGDYNYGEALQKSLIFYELQRSGDLPEMVRCNWRGDSALTDGADNGIDLTGGWYDAGDHAKFNLPMAYSCAMLCWSLYEDRQSYEESNQLEYIEGDIRWVTDYLIKCHPEDEVFYYQVADGNIDHSWWGPAEVMSMNRPSYKVTKDNPGSAVVGEAAAALAAASLVFEESDPDYSALCLEHAKSLYAFADSTRSDSGYTAANGFYDSWSGFYDELAWAGAWLYMATSEDSYLTNAESCYTQANQDYNWAMCWDDVHIGAALLLARLTNSSTYTDAVEKHLDWWTTGVDGDRITYTPKGLAWLDSWGSLRYATTTSFLAIIYSRWDGCPDSKASTYWDFAVSQVNYALGSTGFSYQIGFGDSYPQHPHHRTSQGSYCDNMNEPGTARHTLYGALVGGPDANDGYTDEVTNYCTNEVACDYNAGFTGALAALYSEYHGKTLIDFGAVETISVAEYSAEGSVNVSGDDFIEIRSYIYNLTAWPARKATDLEYRYFIDLSEVYSAGGDASSIEVTTNYMQNGVCEGLKVWDEENHIYYLSVTFNDGSLYPGGQSQFKSEIQVRMRNPNGAWDNSNDYSYSGLADGSTTAIYENGILVFGSEPGNEGTGSGTVVTPSTTTSGGDDTTTSTSTPVTGGTTSASSDSLSLNVRYDSLSANSNSISGTMEITNKGSDFDLSTLSIKYYITNDSNGSLVFDCYHSAVNGAGGQYTGLNSTNGSFASASGENADTCLTIVFGDNVVVGKDATITVSFAIHYSDWTNLNTTNDYSALDVNNIVITSGGTVVLGSEP